MRNVKRTWNVNGERRTAEFPPMRRFLDVLRNDLGLKGSKEGCGEGECGACTVILNGEPVVSCFIPAGQIADGSEIITVEGLEKTDGGRILQQAYIEKGAVQCGFCIPGTIVSSYSLLSKNNNPSNREIREAHEGNLCRCTGYDKIVEAVRRAAEQWPTGKRVTST